MSRPDAGRTRLDAEIAAELEHHIVLRIRDNLAAGMSSEEAREEALRRFGDVEEYRRRTREVDERIARVTRQSERIDLARRSMRDAVRSVVKRPGFTLVVVATLGLGLGANTAIYTLLDRVVMRPLPYASADRLVAVNHPVPGVAADAVWGLSFAGYFRLQDENRSLEELGVYMTRSVTLTGDGEPERVTVARSTRSLLSVLGAQPSVGRLFTEEEDLPRVAAVAVLGHAFWERRFGGDEGVVGRTIDVDGVPAEVVGVMSSGFELPRRDVDLWMPLNLDRARRAENSHYLGAIGRLRDRVTPDAATADLARLVSQFTSVFPEAYPESFMRDSRFDVAVVPLRAEVIGDIGRALWILLASVGLVLAIACANVANLFLVRAETRRRETAIRSALGAGRRELAWQCLSESLLLSTLAGLCGVALAVAGLRALVALSPSSIPRIREVALDGSSLLFAGAVSLAAGLVFGTIALLRGGGAAAASLRESGRRATASRQSHAVRGGLVMAQVALSVVLLSGAGLLLRSFINLRAVDPGVAAQGVLTFEISLPRRYQTHEAVNDFYRSLTQNLEQLPGITHAGATTWLPAAGTGGCSAVWVEGQPVGPNDAPPCVIVGKTTPGFVESLGMKVRGRPPAWSENDGTGSAVVTRAAADRFWPGEDPLGKGIRVWGPGEPYYRVAAVVEGVRADLDGSPVEAVYLPMLPIEGAPLWEPSRWSVILVRTATGRPEDHLPMVQRVLAEIDPLVPIANAQTMQTIIDGGLARRSFTLMLLGIAAGMALILSIVGLYGVVSYIVGQRAPEIGIRMALGARGDQVRAMVVRQALRWAGGGIALGLLTAVAATRTLRALLFEVSPTDPVILGATCALLLVIALTASLAPAQRAARVNPLRSLNAD